MREGKGEKMNPVHVYTSLSTRAVRDRERTAYYRLEMKTENGKTARIEGTFPVTGTVNQAELHALYGALTHLTRSCRLVIHTGSAYIERGFKKWMQGWVRAGWKNAKGKPVANRKEWLEVLKILNGKPFQVVFDDIEEKNGRKCLKD